MIPGGELRVRTRYWSNGHGAGRVTATARGVQRTVPVDHATSGGMSGDGSHAAAVRAILAALDVDAAVPDAYHVAGPRRVYVIRTTDAPRVHIREPYTRQGALCGARGPFGVTDVRTAGPGSREAVTCDQCLTLTSTTTTEETQR